MSEQKRGASADNLWTACIHCGEAIHIKTIDAPTCPCCGDWWFEPSIGKVVRELIRHDIEDEV